MRCSQLTRLADQRVKREIKDRLLTVLEDLKLDMSKRLSSSFGIRDLGYSVFRRDALSLGKHLDELEERASQSTSRQDYVFSELRRTEKEVADLTELRKRFDFSLKFFDDFKVRVSFEPDLLWSQLQIAIPDLSKLTAAGAVEESQLLQQEEPSSDSHPKLQTLEVGETPSRFDFNQQCAKRRYSNLPAIDLSALKSKPSLPTMQSSGRLFIGSATPRGGSNQSTMQERPTFTPRMMNMTPSTHSSASNKLFISPNTLKGFETQPTNKLDSTCLAATNRRDSNIFRRDSKRFESNSKQEPGRDASPGFDYDLKPPGVNQLTRGDTLNIRNLLLDEQKVIEVIRSLSSSSCTVVRINFRNNNFVGNPLEMLRTALKKSLPQLTTIDLRKNNFSVSKFSQKVDISKLLDLNVRIIM